MSLTRSVLLAGALTGTTILSLAPAALAGAGPAQKSIHNLAGYVAVAQPAHDLTAGWVQPAVTCTSEDSQAKFWVGLTHGHAGFRIGTAVECRNGRATYYAVSGKGNSWGEFGETVEAGDHLSVLITWTRGSFELSFSNDTQGWGQGESGSGPPVGPRTTHASFVVQARSDGEKSLPLANFGTTVFDGCTVNGKPLAGAEPQKMVMTGAGGQVRATPSAISAGGDFTLTWKHS